MAEADSEAVQDQATDASSPNGSPESDLGLGHPETYLGQSDPVEEQSEEASVGAEASKTTAPSNDPESPENQGLRWADYTHKTQALKERGAELERAYQEKLSALEKQNETDTRLLRLEQPTQQEVLLSDRVSQAMRDPNISELDREGLGVIAEMTRTMETLQGEVEELRAFKETSEPMLNSAVTTTEGIAAEKKAARDDGLRLQLETARGEFGDDKVMLHKDSILALAFQGVVNPATSQPWVARDVVAVLEQTGLKNGALADNKTAAAAAQAEVAPGGLLVGGTESGSIWSEDQAKAAIAQTL